MRKKSISYNETFINALAELGFKRKNKYTFRRIWESGIISDFVFNDTRPRSHVTSYNILIHITIKELVENGEWITENHGTAYVRNIGYTGPENTYFEWYIDDDDPEEEDMITIRAIINYIRQYAVPYIERRLSTEEGIVEEMMCGRFIQAFNGSEYMCPLYLFMKGRRREAIKYTEDYKKMLLRSYDEHKEGVILSRYDALMKVSKQIYERYGVNEDEIKAYS